MQASSDSVLGRYYTTYYKIDSFPYISVIDPRTGELMSSLSESKAKLVSKYLEDILSNYGKSPADDEEEEEQSSNSPQEEAKATAETNPTCNGSSLKRKCSESGEEFGTPKKKVRNRTFVAVCLWYLQPLKKSVENHDIEMYIIHSYKIQLPKGLAW